MRVRIKTILNGPGQSEAVVAIKTTSNDQEEVVVHTNQIADNTLQVWQVGQKDGKLLVELPQESASGNWRVWVDSGEVAA